MDSGKWLPANTKFILTQVDFHLGTTYAVLLHGIILSLNRVLFKFLIQKQHQKIAKAWFIVGVALHILNIANIIALPYTNKFLQDHFEEVSAPYRD